MENDQHNLRELLSKDKALAEEEFFKRVDSVSPPVIYGLFSFDNEYKTIPASVRKLFKSLVDAHLTYERDETPPGITILGAPGTGKTKAVFALAYHLLEKYWLKGKNFSVRSEPFIVEHIDWVQAVRAASRYSTDETEQDAARSLLDTCMKWPGILFMDDVGAANMPDFVTEHFYKLIDTRLKNWRPTVFISNATIEELGENLDPRVADRLRRWTKLVNFVPTTAEAAPF